MNGLSVLRIRSSLSRFHRACERSGQKGGRGRSDGVSYCHPLQQGCRTLYYCWACGAKDPETGQRNVSINRMQYKGKTKLGIRMMPPQHLGVIQEKSEKKGKDLEVAVAIGNHPFEILVAATTVAYGMDEFTLSSALRKEPLELVKCETVDLEVPATAEIVLEGVVRAGIREDEGPFGDFMQYYIPVMANHVFEVKAITHRKDAIYQTIQASSLEDIHLLASLGKPRSMKPSPGLPIFGPSAWSQPY